MSAPVVAADGGRLAAAKDRLRRAAHAALSPVVRGLGWLGVGPDALTVVGALLNVLAAVAFFEGAFVYGSLLLVLGGVCDILDGELARRRATTSRFGAFLDSTLDRLSEGIVFAGIAGFYVANLVELAHDPARVLVELSRGLEPRTWAAVALIAIVALIGSFLVSYTRARAEGLGLECRVGWFERPERTVVLIAAGLFGVGPVMPGALLLLAGMSFMTAGQRVVHVWKHTRGAGLDASR